ncbi:VCBS repeat domain-containing M23 family metallopeptidase [archaeon]|nr:VCBS repeat domain-containing M23 family metallopeptidase [archaeon]
MTLPLDENGLDSSITSGFYYDDGSYHGGIDFDTPNYADEAVYAAADGVVVGISTECRVGKSYGYGTSVVLGHNLDDDSAYEYFTRYAHFKCGSVAVSDGQKVCVGKKLGNEDSTGYSIGDHLHFELRSDPYGTMQRTYGSAIDPYGINSEYNYYPGTEVNARGSGYYWDSFYIGDSSHAGFPTGADYAVATECTYGFDRYGDIGFLRYNSNDDEIIIKIGLSSSTDFNQHSKTELEPPLLERCDTNMDGSYTDVCPLKAFSGDFNGDGDTDVVMGVKWGVGFYEWRTFINKGDGKFIDAGVWSSTEFGGDDTYLIGDYNGDGWDDIAYIREEATGTKTVYVSLNYRGYYNACVGDSCTNRGGYFTTSTQWYSGIDSTSKFLVGDYNGDGKDDIVEYRVYGRDNKYRWWVLLSNGAGFSRSKWENDWGKSDKALYFVSGDFNNDGKYDIARGDRKSNTDIPWYVMLSDGTEFDGDGKWIDDFGGTDNYEFFSADLNGDGYDDLVSKRKAGTNTYKWRGGLSSGTSFTNSGRWENDFGNDDSLFFVGQFNYG